MTRPASPAPSPSPSPASPVSARPSGTAGQWRWLLRLHRAALYTWVALLAVLAAALLWLWGPLTDAAAEGWRQYAACGASPHCAYDQDAILRYKDVYNYTTFALTALPFLVAAWSGGALFGRELESGTARLAWAQGISPARWLTLKLAAPAVLVTAGTSLLVWLHNRAWEASRGRIDTAKSWYDGPTLHTNGPTTVAYALAGLAAGAVAALLLRRTLPALGLALGLALVVRTACATLLPHLWPASTSLTGLATGYTRSGFVVDSGLVTSYGARVADPGCGPQYRGDCSAVYDRMGATGFYVDYHPFSHFWPLQLTTTALALTLVSVLTLAAYLLLRRTTGALRGTRRPAGHAPDPGHTAGHATNAGPAPDRTADHTTNAGPAPDRTPGRKETAV